jgi:hypothetical protein
VLTGELTHMHDAASGVGEFSPQFQPVGAAVSPSQPAAPKASEATRNTFHTRCACEVLKGVILERASSAHLSALRENT